MQIFPYNAIRALEKLQSDKVELTICMAGKKYSDTILPSSVRYLGHIPYEQTLLNLKTCTCLIANEGNETEYMGSGKVLDAIAAGVPILAYRSKVREEQLGKDYLGFYTDEHEAYQIAKLILTNEFFRKTIVSQLAERYKIYSVNGQGDYLYEQFLPLLNATKYRYNIGLRQP
jgi:glycosyltransferase involved in cell wall biosynthesis